MKKSLAFLLFLLLCWLLYVLFHPYVKVQAQPGTFLTPSTPVHSPVSNASYTVTGEPTISANFINHVLAAYGSPAQGKGQALYDLGVKYGIDPVYALAFFFHESRFGTTGEARVTLSLGNERCINDRPCVDQAQGGYAQMESWEDGFEHWYQLILYGYVQGRVTIPLAGHTCATIDQIIPVYVRGTSQANQQAYMAFVKQAVDTWRAGHIIV